MVRFSNKMYGKTQLTKFLANPIFYLISIDQSCSALGASHVGAGGKEPPANAGDIRDTGLILGLGRSLGGGHGKPLQYSCLENPKDRGA